MLTHGICRGLAIKIKVCPADFAFTHICRLNLVAQYLEVTGINDKINIFRQLGKVIVWPDSINRANGRMSRALTVLLMLKNKYSYMPYASMESIIEASKDAYYRALRGTQKTIWSDKVDYHSWLTFFVTSLQKQKRALEDKIKNIKKVDTDKLSPTAREIMSLFASNSEMSISEMVKRTGKNVERVRKSVQRLVKKGYLTKLGTTRGVSYIRNSEE